MEAQVLDAMDLERERGITIKAHPVRLNYTAPERRAVRPQPDRHARPRRLRLRGHALARRVRRRAAAGRRLAGRRGADAGQRLPGRREQPRDHPGHQQDRPAERAAGRVQAADRGHHRPRRRDGHPGQRQGRHRRPARSSRRSSSASRRRAATRDAPLKALIFDSWFDPYRGVVIVVRVIDGALRTKIEDPADGDRRRTTRSTASASSRRRRSPVDELGVGEVGFVVANIKRVADAKIGDTVTETRAADDRSRSPASRN